jgi:HAD superfamily hydrolase (TIGR01509 family)
MQLYIAIFDVNGVLLDPEPQKKYFLSKELELFNKNGRKLSLTQINTAWKSAVRGMGIGPEELLAARLRFLEKLGMPKSIIPELEALDKESFKHYTPMEPAEHEVLRKIKKLGVYIAALTDTIHTASDKKLMMEAAGLSNMIDGIFVPDDVGHRKPDPEAYKAVLESFKAEPENAIFIGHEADEIKGAKLLGITTISYKSNIKAADYAANSFNDIFHIIKELKR